MSTEIALAAPKRFRLERWHWHVLVALAYCLLALFAYHPVWPGESTRLAASANGDLTLNAWYSQWYAYALQHGLNPFFSEWANYPAGANVVGNTSTPLLNLLFAPFTMLTNGIATFNLVMWLAFPISAYSAFFVASRWVKSLAGAALAGLIYGFSPYVVGQGLGHTVLVFVPVPPLIFYCLYRIIQTARRGIAVPRRTWIWLGLWAAAQFLISVEVLATTCIVSLISCVILGLCYRHEVWVVLRHAVRPITAAGIVFVVLVAYPAYFILLGPQHFSDLVQGLDVPYRSDLLSAITPTYNQLLGPMSLKTIGSSFVGGDGSENAGYLGIPGILLLIALVLRFRRNRWMDFVGIMVPIAYLLSLGGRLSIAHHNYPFILPFWILHQISFVNSMMPVRFALYMFFFFGLACALAVDEFHAIWVSHVSEGSVRYRVGLGAFAGLGMLTVASLIPAWPYALLPTDLPSVFTTSAVKVIPEGSVALTYPYSGPFNDQPMLWQAAANFRFKLLGAYMYFPASPAFDTAVLQPGDVEAYLQAEFLKGKKINYPVFPTLPPAEYENPSSRDLRKFVRDNGISVLMVDRTVPNESIVANYFTRGFGKPTYESKDVAIWTLK